MAHFAELDINNKVIRVVVGCNIDIADNGGEQSEQAAQYFLTTSPLSPEGVKWVQTSINNNFRKQYAGIGYTFDSIKNKFIKSQPFPSWSLDSNDDWQAPTPRPVTSVQKEGEQDPYVWDEENLKWKMLPLKLFNESGEVIFIGVPVN